MTIHLKWSSSHDILNLRLIKYLRFPIQNLTFKNCSFSTKMTCWFYPAETLNLVNRIQQFLTFNNDTIFSFVAKTKIWRVQLWIGHVTSKGRVTSRFTGFLLTIDWVLNSFPEILKCPNYRAILSSSFFHFLFDLFSIYLYFLYLVSEDPGIQWSRSSTWLLVGNLG